MAAVNYGPTNDPTTANGNKTVPIDVELLAVRQKEDDIDMLPVRQEREEEEEEMEGLPSIRPSSTV